MNPLFVLGLYGLGAFCTATFFVAVRLTERVGGDGSITFMGVLFWPAGLLAYAGWRWFTFWKNWAERAQKKDRGSGKP